MTITAEVSSDTARGTALLIGRDAAFSPEEGAALIASAVEQGDPQAMSVMATLKGAGVWARQDWSESLELLCRAAEGGADDARAQLVMIAMDEELAEAARRGSRDPGIWRQLRASVDLERWIVPPKPTQICDWPKIWTVERFATRELCSWLIGRGRGKFTPSMMFSGRNAAFHATRTCSDFSFSLVEGGVVMLLLRTRVSAITGQAIAQMEPPQIFHYTVGQSIDPHYDSLYDGANPYGGQGNYTGDRLATLLMYLNDDYDGGVLEFVKVGVTYKGKAGDAIFFASLREGKPDPQALHGAGKVTRGEKFILSQWIHDRPFGA